MLKRSRMDIPGPVDGNQKPDARVGQTLGFLNPARELTPEPGDENALPYETSGGPNRPVKRARLIHLTPERPSIEVLMQKDPDEGKPLHPLSGVIQGGKKERSTIRKPFSGQDQGKEGQGNKEYLLAREKERENDRKQRIEQQRREQAEKQRKEQAEKAAQYEQLRKDNEFHARDAELRVQILELKGQLRRKRD